MRKTKCRYNDAEMKVRDSYNNKKRIKLKTKQSKSNEHKNTFKQSKLQFSGLQM